MASFYFKALVEQTFPPHLKTLNSFMSEKSGHYQRVVTPNDFSPWFSSLFVSANRTQRFFLPLWMTVSPCGFSQSDLWTQTLPWFITWLRPHILSFWHLDKKIVAASQFHLFLSAHSAERRVLLLLYVCRYSRKLIHLLEFPNKIICVLFLPRELQIKFLIVLSIPPQTVIKVISFISFFIFLIHKFNIYFKNWRLWLCIYIHNLQF